MNHNETVETKKKTSYSIAAKDLAALGKEQIPPELISNTHLIYSSPATLAFNSPGAQGFGVKRAGLAIPDSVMLLVAPGCCGRNTTLLAELPEYHDRFFYLMMDETDIVTGRHLKNIPQAVEEICQSLPKMPSVVMICLTCVDALLGTDMERVCRKAMEKVSIPVLPCYMYALTREGRKPPMVHVRQSIYSLLEPKKKRPAAVNILGHFAPLLDDCELYQLLSQAGFRSIREISRCKSYEEYQNMAEANFNLVLNPEARFAAQDLQKRLQIPSVELVRLYQLDKIRHQYQIFAGTLGMSWDDTPYYEKAEAAIRTFHDAYPDTVFSIGEGCNAEPFELALALLQYGFQVSEIFGTPSADNFIYIRKIAALSPETRIYSNLEPTMLYYDCSETKADLTIGRDAAYYHPKCPNVEWSEDVQPFGYAGVTLLFEQMHAARQKEEETT